MNSNLIPCGDCHGTGHYIDVQCDWANDEIYYVETDDACPECGGEGFVGEEPELAVAA